jgi:hypothetical protein
VTYIEVPISSTQLLALNTTPVELLPLLNSGEYYDNVKMNFEYNFVSKPYAVGLNTTALYITGLSQTHHMDSYIGTEFLTLTGSKVAVIEVNPQDTFDNKVNLDLVNKYRWTDLSSKTFSDLYLTAIGKFPLDPFTNGDGNILVKIWYEVRTVGTEL